MERALLKIGQTEKGVVQEIVMMTSVRRLKRTTVNFFKALMSGLGFGASPDRKVSMSEERIGGVKERTVDPVARFEALADDVDGEYWPWECGATLRITRGVYASSRLLEMEKRCFYF